MKIDEIPACTNRTGGVLTTALVGAIRSKRELAGIYTELARRIGNPRPQKHLFVMLKEDLQHRALLEEIYAKHAAAPTEPGTPKEKRRFLTA